LQGLLLLFCFAGLSAGTVGMLRGLKTARFFLTAWISVIAGTVCWVLTISGVFPLNKFVELHKASTTKKATYWFAVLFGLLMLFMAISTSRSWRPFLH